MKSVARVIASSAFAVIAAVLAALMLFLAAPVWRRWSGGARESLPKNTEGLRGLSSWVVPLCHVNSTAMSKNSSRFA
jgi:hypothetical protein